VAQTQSTALKDTTVLPDVAQPPHRCLQMGDVNSWVKNQLFDVLGFAEKNLVGYTVSLAKKSKSESELLSNLAALDVPTNARTKQFARELMARAGGGGGGGRGGATRAPSATQRREQEARSMAAKNDTYAMLKEPELDPKALKAAKKAQRKLRKRSVREEEEEDDAPPAKRAETAEERKIRLMDEDQAEMQAFSSRLKERDDSKTKKSMLDEDKTGERLKELAQLKQDEKEEHLRKLRVRSREDYLVKRTDQKLVELEDDLKDEDYLYNGVKLTKKEKIEKEMKLELLKLAKEKQNMNFDEGGYDMPDAYVDVDEEGVAVKRDKDRELEVLHGRTQDIEETVRTEQEVWEDHQLKYSTVKFGSSKAAERGSEFDFVFDDQIDFVSTDTIAAENTGKKKKKKKKKKRKDGDASSSSSSSSEEDTGAPAVPSPDDEDPSLSESDRKHQAILKGRKLLPIFPYREDLLAAIEEYQVLVIVGETGSGKTTQVPQFLHEAGWTKKGKVGCTQPRRVAAMSVAARVAEEMNVKIGNEVGYSIRFEDCTSDRTIVKYMTDGMLLREFLGEPDLASYSVMIIDEAHERSLHTDVLFGLVKDIARFRPDLKLLLSSATVNSEKFSEFFDDAPVFNIPGRRYPVDIMYTKAPEADYLDASVVTCLQVHITQPPGDILVFMTGQEEIELATEALQDRTRGLGTKIGELLVCPIYANLPSDMQAKIFDPAPPGGRKVVLATNIAETSLTIDGIVYVIDTGFVKQTSYNPRTGMESLIVTPCSKAGANQRAGRAGRTCPGKCFRLYTAWSFHNELDDDQVPEIQRTNLGSVVLLLKSLGINDLIHFDFMDPPPAETLIRALEQLYALGALNDRGELTKLGRRMAEFPLDPMQSKMLIASEEYKCSEEMIAIAAMLSAGNAIFYRPKDKAVLADAAKANFHRGYGDHLALLNCYTQWAELGFSVQWCFENFVQIRTMKRARDVKEQLEGLLERTEIEMMSNSDHEVLRKCIASGFFYHTAKLQKNGSYRTVKNPQNVHIHPSSALQEELPRWVVYHELVLTSKEFMRQIIEINPEWLVEIAPHYYKANEIEDENKKKLPKMIGKAAGDGAADPVKGAGAGSAAERAAGDDMAGSAEGGDDDGFARDVIYKPRN
jgi:pre-mRNA-splicing factor ATP-dependent RNA helicase DHX16